MYVEDLGSSLVSEKKVLGRPSNLNRGAKRKVLNHKLLRTRIPSERIDIGFPFKEPKLFADVTDQVNRIKYVITEIDYSDVGYSFYKRFFDLSLSLAMLIILAPVLLVVALLVKLTSKGSVIYSQLRLTEGGRPFYLFKFRTMRQDAERSTGPVWASTDDPRITKIGKFLRRTRLDELPQLINVIQGDMSLIGPRPERPEISFELSKKFHRFNDRLKVKAGLTGLAQIGSGYAACIKSYRRKLAHDIVYVRRKSVLLDLKIAFRTISVILSGDGAR